MTTLWIGSLMGFNYSFLLLNLILTVVPTFNLSHDTSETAEDALIQGDTSPLIDNDQMTDEELWNLLKQFSRNSTDEPGFTDYEEYTIVDEVFPATEPSQESDKVSESFTESFSDKSYTYQGFSDDSYLGNTPPSGSTESETNAISPEDFSENTLFNTSSGDNGSLMNTTSAIASQSTESSEANWNSELSESTVVTPSTVVSTDESKVLLISTSPSTDSDYTNPAAITPSTELLKGVTKVTVSTEVNPSSMSTEEVSNNSLMSKTSLTGNEAAVATTTQITKSSETSSGSEAKEITAINPATSESTKQVSDDSLTSTTSSITTMTDEAGQAQSSEMTSSTSESSAGVTREFLNLSGANTPFDFVLNETMESSTNVPDKVSTIGVSTTTILTPAGAYSSQIVKVSSASTIPVSLQAISTTKSPVSTTASLNLTRVTSTTQPDTDSTNNTSTTTTAQTSPVSTTLSLNLTRVTSITQASTDSTNNTSTATNAQTSPVSTTLSLNLPSEISTIQPGTDSTNNKSTTTNTQTSPVSTILSLNVTGVISTTQPDTDSTNNTSTTTTAQTSPVSTTLSLNLTRVTSITQPDTDSTNNTSTATNAQTSPVSTTLSLNLPSEISTIQPATDSTNNKSTTTNTQTSLVSTTLSLNVPSEISTIQPGTDSTNNKITTTTAQTSPVSTILLLNVTGVISTTQPDTDSTNNTSTTTTAQTSPVSTTLSLNLTRVTSTTQPNTDSTNNATTTTPTQPSPVSAIVSLNVTSVISTTEPSTESVNNTSTTTTIKPSSFSKNAMSATATTQERTISTTESLNVKCTFTPTQPNTDSTTQPRIVATNVTSTTQSSSATLRMLHLETIKSTNQVTSSSIPSTSKILPTVANITDTDIITTTSTSTPKKFDEQIPITEKSPGANSKNQTSKKKTSLDPKKKIFILMEEEQFSQITLKPQTQPQPTSFNSRDPSPTSLPMWQTTPFTTKKISVFEPRKKFTLSTDETEAKTENKKNQGSMTISPIEGGLDQPGRSNILDSSRIFMINEVTSIPQTRDQPFIKSNGFDIEREINYKKSENKPANANVDTYQKQISDSSKKPGQLTNSTTKIKNSFDPRRIQVIDEFPGEAMVAKPTNKSKFNLNRKFVIDSSDFDKNEMVPVQKVDLINRITITRPKIEIVPSYDVPSSKKPQPNYKSTEKDTDEKLKIYTKPTQHSSPPELLCFEVRNGNRKPLLSCVHLNSTARSHVMHFFTNINNNNQPSGYNQKAPITVKKVFLKNKNPSGTSVLIKTLPTMNGMNYALSGSVSHSGAPGAEINLNAPGQRVFVTNAQTQDIVRHSIIPMKRIANRQNVLFLEQPPDSQGYLQMFPQPLSTVSTSGYRKKLIFMERPMEGYQPIFHSSLATETASINRKIPYMWPPNPEGYQHMNPTSSPAESTSANRKNVILLPQPPNREGYHHIFPSSSTSGRASVHHVSVLERPPNHEDYRQMSPSGRTDVNIRLKRSTGTKCNTIGLYEDEGTSLAFVFDNTGSMQEELQQMKDTAIHITQQLTEKKKNVIKDYVLVTFNDPDVGVPFCTSNYEEFINALNVISVGGGQDCPEMALTGLMTALQVTRPGSFIFVITDADAKDYYEEVSLRPLIMRQAPYIFILMTERCMYDDQRGFDVFYSISGQTNGHLIMMSKDELRENSLLKKLLDKLTEDYLQKGLVPLKKIYSSKAAPQTYSVPVPIDEGINKVTFVVAGSQPKLDVTDPKGSNPTGEPKEFPQYKTVTYSDPLAGIWKAHVGSSSGHSFSSFGISKTQFKVGFSLLKTDKISETSHRPLKDTDNYILVEASSPESVGNITHIDLVSVSGNFLKTIHLKRDPYDNKLFSGGPFVPPDEYFNAEINGFSSEGSPLKRISSAAIFPQKFKELPYITLANEKGIYLGDTFIIKCHVESLVPAEVKIYKKDNQRVQRHSSLKQTGDIHLELRNISLTDQGIYECSATNKAGTKTKQIKITVLVNPPKVFVKDEVLFIEKNTVLIPCNVTSLQPFMTTWQKGTSSSWKKLEDPLRTYSSENGLIIHNPTMYDEGWYQCTASNIGGVSSGNSYLKMSIAPSINISGIQRFYKNFNITITCSSLKGIPSPQFKWTKSGVDFIGDDKRIFITFLEKYTMIEILNAVQEDEGSYSCTAFNFAGQDKQDLNLVYEEKPKAVAAVKSCFTIYGDNCILKCFISGIPIPEVIWKKNGQTLNPLPTSNIKILNKNSLLISNAQLSDSGVYSCIVQSSIGYSEDTIVVNITGTYPQIREAPVDTSIELEENGRLSCIAVGIPEPKISWLKNSKKLITNNENENVLEISNASLNDVGEYTCIAENLLGKVESRANVSVTGGVVPILRKEKDLLVKKVLVDEKVELECVVIEGKPMPRIEWYKDGRLLSEQPSSGMKLENGSYFISSVSPVDTGFYECSARNEFGTDVKRIQLKFYDPPRINLSVTSNVYAVVGQTTKLICNLSGDPKPTVTWKRHNNKAMRGRHIQDTNELVFDDVTVEDKGRYICQGENIAGVARRAYALNVMVPPKIDPWPIEKFVEAGNIVTLECRNRAVPRPSILWLKNNITLLKDKYYGQFLRFHAKQSDSGMYLCIAENQAGKDMAKTNLIVLVPPQIKDGDTVVKAISGGEAVLPCEVSGNPQPSVTWYSNDGIIKKQIGSEPGTLHLLGVTEADAGTYICQAENKAGSYKKKIELVILTPPKVSPWTEPLKVVVGEYLNVTCKAFANPEATILWLKDGKPVPSDFLRSTKTLEFIAEKDHKGIYTCEARNEAGKDSKDFLLIILDRPTFAQHLPFSVDILRGNDITIPCVAFGDPKPIMGWNRSEIVLRNDIRRIIDSETGQLTILKAALEDDGYYNCTASNRAGLVWRTVELNVLELPTAILTVNSIILKEGEQVEFNCNATGKPKPNIIWKKDDKILSTKNVSKLRFPVRYDDAGNYTCFVKNLAGEDYSTVSISVSVHPSIPGSREERIKILKNESVIMNCSAEGFPEPEIIWYFNDTKFGSYEPKIVRNRDILVLKHSAPEDAGIYTCEASNSAGSAKKRFIIYVHVKPIISAEIDTNISIKEGKDFSIDCTAYGIPEPKITWTKGGRTISSISRDVSVAVHDNMLLLYNSDNSTEGIYTCTATNMEGIDTKQYTILVEANKKEVKEGTKEVSVTEGGYITLDCDAKPGAKIEWLKDNKPITISERLDDVHFMIWDSGKVLKIAEAYSEDIGLYSCTAVHPEGSTTTSFALDVHIRPYFTDLYPTLKHTVIENQPISLQCPAYGNPMPQVNWRLAENDLPINTQTVPGVQIFGENDNSLLIRSAKHAHSGLYSCLAVNNLGKENRIFDIKVIGPPQRLGPELSNIEVVAGRKLELDCSIGGPPYPNFKWIYESQTGEVTTLPYITKNIRLVNLEVEDEGLYTCVASNEAGNSSKTFNISVFNSPRIKRDTDSTFILAEGDDIELSCKSEGNKHVSVQWFFNGSRLNDSNIIFHTRLSSLNKTEYICKLTNVSKESEGFYACLISNIAGSDELKYEVVVVAAPKMPSDDWRKLKTLEYYKGSMIDIKCPVESVDDFKIEWRKNGLPLPAFENQTLRISSSSVEDEGEYVCIASNIAGQLTSKFQVEVLASPTLLNPLSNTTLTILLDKKLALNCSVVGNPLPEVLWTKNMKEINNETFPQVILSGNHEILEIDEVDSSDSGKYSCYCSNVAGFVENHFNVEIIVPPMVAEENKTSTEKVINTVLYRRVVLKCPLVASPEPYIRWFKESEEIAEDNPLFITSHDRKILIVNHAKESDAGMYKCIGTNHIGDKTFTFFLHVSIVMEWGPWSEWSNCSSSCGGGIQARMRQCLGDSNEILSEYIHFKNSSCVGPYVDNRPCNSHTCPINGNWSDWNGWSDCSSSCGKGHQRRNRRCNNPPPTNGGEDCIGETYQDRVCELEPCPVNGNWGPWSDWSVCTATCGYSLKMRTRRCNNPPPEYGGLPCSGNSRDITVCKKQKCEDGYDGWSSWSQWSECSVTCGTGRQTRKRICLGGVYHKSCIGESRERRLCHREACIRRRLPRSAEVNVYGELNGQPIEETFIANIEENSNETEIIAVSQNIIEYNSSLTYLPFITSPVSWLAAHESDVGKNGFSITNGSFHENTTYLFNTGEEMEMQSDAEIENPMNPLKVYIKVNGSIPIDNKATIIIDPYEENMIQTGRKTIETSSNTAIQVKGKSIPVSWKKKIEFPENRHNKLVPVERLKSKKYQSKFNKKKGRIEYLTGATVTSSFKNNSCPKGFQYDEETGECQDMNECVRKWLNKCYETEVCINTIGSYSCECRDGYRERPNSAGCKDVNECLEGSHQCSHACQNVKGTYQCLCPYNMILSEDLLNCVATSEEEYDENYIDNIDYLELGQSEMTTSRTMLRKNNKKGLRNLVLKNTQEKIKKPPQRNITCLSGFKIGQNECEDIDECIENENACTTEQLCMNTPGSYICIDAPCPDKFEFSPETRSCVLLCLENEIDCTDGALLSESLQIITIPVYKANYTFYPFTEILILSSYDDNNLPLDGSIYEIVQNESGMPAKIRSENRAGVLYAANYFEVSNRERLILMSSNYDSNGEKLHSTMFLVLLYNTKSVNI